MFQFDKLLCTAGMSACLMLGVSVRSLLSGEADLESLKEELREARGLCVVIGLDEVMIEALSECDGLLVHCLDPSEKRIADLRGRLNEISGNRIVAEHWAKRFLPHASNLANMVVINKTDMVHSEEVERILCPGGIALKRHEGSHSKSMKPVLDSLHEWRHQWHSPDGSLTTEDERIGVPTGIQWLSGPLFAMAGRKSSTQTLVSSGGINFYVTQNVMENVGKPVDGMRQFLVARDAFNGLVIWKREWEGPFVTGNGETNPRMIASPDRLWAVTDFDTLSAIDVKTGEILNSLSVGCQVDKILHQNRSLFALSNTIVISVDEQLEKEQWRYQGKNLSGLTISQGRGYLIESGRSKDGRFKHCLIGLDLATGAELFRSDTQPYVAEPRVRINFASDGLVTLQAHGSFHVFNNEGKHLWSKSTEARPGKSYVDERYVGHFYRNGLIWMLLENSPREPQGQNVWVGLNPTSGDVVRELVTQGNWPRTATPAKMGCQLLLASNRYIMIPRQSTFIDFETGEKHSFKFTRGGCGLGFVAANRLLYSHPHACGCFSEAIRGFMAMHDQPAPSLVNTDLDEDRLALHFQPKLERSEDGAHWPIHRGDGQRSAFTNFGLPDGLDGRLLTPNWKATVCHPSSNSPQTAWALRTGNHVSACTVADGTVFVADVDSGRLSALDLSSGRLKWDFVAAGRIDSPPTVYHGICVFGAHDGYVYCLDAADGRLAWKYRVAPSDRRIVAYGGLESAWPVAGTLVVRDNRVFASAGRGPDADGGMFVVALDILTGRPTWEQRIQDENFWGLNDYLIEGRESLFLSNWEFDRMTGSNQEASADSEHLRGGKVGLLEASWTKHDLALRKEIQTWTARGKEGQLMTFGPHATATFNAESHAVVVDGDASWELEIDSQEQVTSMAMTPRYLLLAGGTNRSDVYHGGFLRVVELETGRLVQELPLVAEAAFDALAVAGNYVLVSTQSGLLCCFKAE